MAMARPSGLETRLLAILDARGTGGGPARWLVVACLAAVLVISAVLAAVHLVAKEPPRPVVSGQVIGPDGKPHEGAEVVVVCRVVRGRPSSVNGRLLAGRSSGTFASSWDSSVRAATRTRIASFWWRPRPATASPR